jgi:hypothetical protein
VSVLVTEDFAGGAAALAGVWTQCGPGGTATINRNGAGLGTQSATDAANDRFVRWNGPTPSADHYAEKTIRGVVGGAVAFCELGCRMAGDAGTFAGYVVYTDGANGVGHTEIARWNAGAPAILANYSPAAAFAAGDRIRIEIHGNQIYVLKNGVVLVPSTGGTFVTDSTLTSGAFGFGSFWGSGATPPTFDDFEGGDFVSVGLPRNPLRRLRAHSSYDTSAPVVVGTASSFRRTLHPFGAGKGKRTKGR